MSFCPKCFNDSLNIASRGAVDILFNKKKMNTGRFLFNQEKETPEQFEEALKEKLKEYFEWYGKFKNKDSLKSIEVCSVNFTCTNKCKIDLNYRFSVVGHLIEENRFSKIVETLANQHGVTIED